MHIWAYTVQACDCSSGGQFIAFLSLFKDKDIPVTARLDIFAKSIFNDSNFNNLLEIL